MRLFRDEYSPFVSIRLFVQYRTTVLVIPAYFVSRIRITWTSDTLFFFPFFSPTCLERIYVLS